VLPCESPSDAKLQNKIWRIRYLGVQKNVSEQYGVPVKRAPEDQDLLKNLEFFKVPQADIETIRSKLTMKIFDEYTNILKVMYSMRFNGRPTDRNVSIQDHSVPHGPTSPFITSFTSCLSNKIRKHKEGETKEGA
jgi:hypothetical protein